MTKEEALDIIIENYENDDKHEQDDVRTAYCAVTECSDCVFRHGQDCTNTIAEMLIARLLKAEEHQETNLEHFRGTVVFDNANGIVHIHLINEWGKSYSDDKGAIDWLLSPYEEPPKRTFKLTQFELDLLDANRVYTYGIEDYFHLESMAKRGYFKDIPTDVPIQDILDNCEVVEE